MAGSDKHGPGPVRHLAGLVLACALAAACLWVWEATPWLTERLAVPELRIMAALAGAFAVLSATQLALSWLERRRTGASGEP
jgi:predicted outer membrane lipoprotein